MKRFKQRQHQFNEDGTIVLDSNYGDLVSVKELMNYFSTFDQCSVLSVNVDHFIKEFNTHNTVFYICEDGVLVIDYKPSQPVSRYMTKILEIRSANDEDLKIVDAEMEKRNERRQFMNEEYQKIINDEDGSYDFQGFVDKVLKM